MSPDAAAPLAVLLAALLWPRWGVLARIRALRASRSRAAVEDALKHILDREHRGAAATPESLAGLLTLPPSRTLSLISRMESAGLLRSTGDGLALTHQGERLALHVVRAHRLWERYLVDEAGLPLGRIHRAAERAEHRLTPADLEQLEAHLGHPLHDPHGDPIPRAGETLPRADAVALTEWPLDRPARITHVEDEPEIVMRQITAADLGPGRIVRVLESTPERIVLSDGEAEHHLAPVVAANIQVVPAAPEERERPAGVIPLSDLPTGAEAEVVLLDSRCRGFTRRRLLDLGLTPGTHLFAELSTMVGDPRAFRVRGTLIALRRRQASQIWVRPVEEKAARAS
ncbi:MAG: iron dependent repressor, metal binding and dimerization domain protein [Gemmatimonadota bacterium]|jgi:DtxR family Mn-dependent transcriptional regulator|nr:hypothetical protein [Gemmatimonadota bacterium]MDP6529120.1 iron dependent repressor, metal binding and dimerization domain protein [Gemmatimonadota bacterium]MDP6802881.1 iron dependent repressor, metal binding and dimerization domain protein [Gemmatimonadota bacterium]MDP7032173.1 iron dependent repressor, metal binding and dimerization domain protein [Gemmatimonadota bacterium]